MRYIDTASRRPEDSLGAWLHLQLTDDVVGLRWQTGFFGIDGASLLWPTLERLRSQTLPTRAVVGSNGGMTLGPDVAKLVEVVGLPRAGAGIGVVSYGAGLFHPKAYHVERADSSQCAYVGSANLTMPGVSGLNIEAGVVLDTRDGDSRELIQGIADSVDAWFATDREGFYRVDGPADIEQLVTDSVLSAAPPPRRTQPEAAEIAAEMLGGSAARPERARLQPLITLPRVRGAVRERAPGAMQLAIAPVAAVPRNGFPAYILFDPNSTTPTSGAAALSGASLPSDAAGLIIRLNRDSARHFENRPGTSNLSVPVATLGTLRFGVYRGTYERPRAEFDLRIRYLGRGAPILVDPIRTNIMAYGFAAGESGHGDVRMVFPAALRTLAARVAAAGLPVPAEDDVALLEWPTRAITEFRLTFVERGSPLFATAMERFSSATQSGELVGDGACWLPDSFSPSWE